MQKTLCELERMSESDGSVTHQVGQPGVALPEVDGTFVNMNSRHNMLAASRLVRSAQLLREDADRIEHQRIRQRVVEAKARERKLQRQKASRTSLIVS